MACLQSLGIIAVLPTITILCVSTSQTSLADTSTAGISNETWLMQFLSQRKENVLGAVASYARPILDDGPIQVQGQVAIQKLIDLDVKEQTITLQVWVYMAWPDDYWRWNPAEFGNITKLTWRIEDKTWIPDVTIFNAVEIKSTNNVDAIINDHNGNCIFISNFMVKVPCEANIREFPFDVHSCKIDLASWSYSGKLLQLSPVEEDNIIPRESIGNQQWEIIEFEQSKKILNDSECCEGGVVVLTYMTTLKRKATFFFFVLILPACLLNVLGAVLFLVPTDFPDKMSIGLSIFLSYIVLLIVLVDATPSAGTSLPILGVFYCVSICLSSATIFASLLVYNIHHCTSTMSTSAQTLLANVGKFLFIASASDIKKVHSEQGLSDKTGSTKCWNVLAEVLNRLFLITYLCVTLVVAIVFLA